MHAGELRRKMAAEGYQKFVNEADVSHEEALSSERGTSGISSAHVIRYRGSADGAERPRNVRDVQKGCVRDIAQNANRGSCSR